MKNVQNIVKFGLLCAFAFLAGCDYGPIEGGEEEIQYETQVGELEFSGGEEENGEGVGAWNFESDLVAGEALPTSFSAHCSCTCSQQADKACRDLKDKRGKKLCPATAQAVDIVGSCVQNGETCGGTCECLDCYTVLGAKCGRLANGIKGDCEWQ